MSRAFRVQISVAAISVAVACLLLAAQVSQQKHLRHKLDLGEIEGDNDDNVDDGRSLGQSRAWGGENRTLWRRVFPWFDILYRNPDKKFKTELDGYLTGIAIQVAHNVFLAHKESMERASLMHGKTRVLQGWGNLWTKNFINPQVKVWDNPKDGYTRGVVRTLAELGTSFGLYRVTQDKYPYPNEKRSASSSLESSSRAVKAEDEADNEEEEEVASRQRPDPRRVYDNLPPFDWPDGKEQVAYRYPRLNHEKNMSSNCYVYALAAQDRGGDTWFDWDAPRWFARWPVKRLTCYEDFCRFKFDESRADRERTGIKRNAWQCSGWQDAGAPIMCGKSNVNFWSYSEYFERRYLTLSYLVSAQEPFNGGCQNSLWALRVADHVDTIEKEIDKLKKSGTL